MTCSSDTLNPTAAGYSIKEYDSVLISCRYTNSAGEPRDLAGVTIKSEVRSAVGVLIDTLNVTVTDAVNGEFNMVPTVDKLPVGTHKIDVLFTEGSIRIASETFTIRIVEAVTKI